MIYPLLPMIYPLLRTISRLALGLFCLLGARANASEIWIGGSRAWPDFVNPATVNQWKFLQAHADGFYINNFAMREPKGTLHAEHVVQLQQMRSLLANKRVFYETDRIHASAAEDTRNVGMFREAGFSWVGSTINYGTDAARTALLVEGGRLPLYYMFGPWGYKEGLESPKTQALIANIVPQAGAAVDGPVTQWRKDAGNMQKTCFDMVRWCHAHQKKFLYLIAPNESGKTFPEETQKLVRAFEDAEACPDIWALSFYGPASFRALLETLPETNPDGTPAPTFAGAAHWVVTHLRDPDHAMRLTVPAQPGVQTTANGLVMSTRAVTKFQFAVQNTNHWCDFAPFVRVRAAAVDPAFRCRWLLGDKDITAALTGDGFNGVRDNRLLPDKSLVVTLEVSRVGAPVRPSALAIELYPNRTEAIASQTVRLNLVP